MKKLLVVLLSLLLISCSTIQLNNTTEILQSPQEYEPKDTVDWNNLQHKITQSKANIIVILWSGTGGFNYMGDRTIEAFNIAHRQGKLIILKLIGNAISMHANVACHADKIEYNGFMAIFHSGFFGHSKNGTKDYSNDRSYFDYCKAKGILTEEDIHHIINLRQKVTLNNIHKDYSEDYK
jgi:hypothetical protein